eukprot:CAMPEP_0114118724 /NCGR_PEP_ID=MMETSP0043_2-20121206/5732_1 /TAXON_ID=464988 /ORGANISM="Hemiselmis andersenii, Strain CCMP644" /LENGTH=201 /DNA_ID=CAMNT_0001211227 /DNA_START=23 /DNA_END=625 /DNA_ORIENTATION=+
MKQSWKRAGMTASSHCTSLSSFHMPGPANPPSSSSMRSPLGLSDCGSFLPFRRARSALPLPPASPPPPTGRLDTPLQCLLTWPRAADRDAAPGGGATKAWTSESVAPKKIYMERYRALLRSTGMLAVQPRDVGDGSPPDASARLNGSGRRKTLKGWEGESARDVGDGSPPDASARLNGSGRRKTLKGWEGESARDVGDGSP